MLLVDPDAVLTRAVASERLEVVARRLHLHTVNMLSIEFVTVAITPVDVVTTDRDRNRDES
jgi:hypothetical protein